MTTIENPTDLLAEEMLGRFDERAPAYVNRLRSRLIDPR